jgi:hypothetical protein
MPYNREAKAHVLHDPRNFIVGLSDEGGAGANVGFAIKQRFAPVHRRGQQSHFVTPPPPLRFV